MRRSVALVWVVGIIVAVLLYAAQPEHLLDGLSNLLGQLGDGIDTLIASFSMQSFLIVRALTVALFIVFIVLGLIAASRGLRAKRTLLVVTFLYAVLLWRPMGGVATVRSWLLAFVLALIAALVMTRRLLAAGSGPVATLRRGEPF